MAAGADKAKTSGGRRWRRRLVRGLLLVLLLLYAAGLGLNWLAPRAGGMNHRGQAVRGECALLFDTTGTAPDGRRQVRQSGHDALLELVAGAGDLLILDQFLVNTFRGRDGEVWRDTTGELVAALCARRARAPAPWTLFITDPVNNAYRPGCPPALQPLMEAGVHVLITDLGQLPDINHVYSPFHRALAPALRCVPGLARPLFANPFDPAAPPMAPLDVLEMLNFKANHRKVAVARTADGRFRALVSSANPHAASSAHGNAGIRLEDGPAPEVARVELELARGILLHRPELLHSRTSAPELLREVEARLAALPAPRPVPPGPRTAALRYCTEAAVAAALEEMLGRSGAGDRVDVLLFYLSDPGIVRALKGAAERGAALRLLLDPNKDAFGRQKNGAPNRPVAQDLHDWAAAHGHDVQIRWFATRGEQGHFKTLRAWNPAAGRDDILIGSANFTPRNLRGYNLESAVAVENAGAAGAEWNALFERLWENRDGVVYSAEFAAYGLPRRAQRLWLQALTMGGNWSGFCTW